VLSFGSERAKLAGSLEGRISPALDRKIYGKYHNAISYLRETDYGALALDMLYRISISFLASRFILMLKMLHLRASPPPLSRKIRDGTQNTEIYSQTPEMIQFFTICYSARQ
jgi:hypothetical protein